MHHRTLGNCVPEALELRIALCGMPVPLDDAVLGHVAEAREALALVRQPLRHGRQGASAVAHGHAVRRRGAAAPQVFTAANLSTPTRCAEEDNVNVPLLLPAASKRFSFRVEARHPGYPVTEDHRAPDFSNCPPALSGSGGTQEAIPLYDDHVSTAVVAVRDPNFHEPGMRVRIGAMSVSDVHFIRVIRRIEGSDSWPEVMVLYSDGNLRLKPQAPPAGGDPAYGSDPAFGSSVIIGPAPIGERPVVNITTLAYDPSKHAFNVRYAAGGKASVKLIESNRAVTRVRVDARYAVSPQTPFATVRSMFVEDGNADVDSVTWADPAGGGRSESIGSFQYANAAQFLFGRQLISRHNTSAPDVSVGSVAYGGR